MGKKGDLLRQLKKQQAVYTFTGEELEAHDRQVVAARLEAAKSLAVKEAAEIDRQRELEMREHVDKVWEENAVTLMSYFLALSCRVLVEHFGWKPPGPRGRNVRIMRYGAELVNELNRLTKVSKGALREYAKETKELYGIEFKEEP